jgi:DNA polymerase
MTAELRQELLSLVRGARGLVDALRGFGLQAVPPAPPPPAAPGPEPSSQAMLLPPPDSIPRLTASDPATALEDVRRRLGDCTRCKLSRRRQHIVFGEGDPGARLVLVGEGPGAEEDRTGRPFVGEAGQLLERILRAMGLGREQVYICNVVKCRPPSNRSPEPDEVSTCGVFLAAQLAALRPSHILALGATAAHHLLGVDTPLGKLRGRFFDHASGARLMPTYHPAYLLRFPLDKKLVWEDVKLVMAELGLRPEGSDA